MSPNKYHPQQLGKLFFQEIPSGNPPIKQGDTPFLGCPKNSYTKQGSG